jgi:hypothetical protein
VEALRPPGGVVGVRYAGELVFVSARPEWGPPFSHEELESAAAVDAIAEPRAGVPSWAPWAWEDRDAGRVRTRVFPVELGIPEDEATGAAAIRLAAIVGREIEIRQGRGSLLYARPLEDGRVEVGGRVVLDEVPLAYPPAVGPPLERADLARVGLDHDVGRARGADREEARGSVARVDDLVSAGVARLEAQDLAALDVAPAVRRAQPEARVEEEQQLLLGQVRVVGVGGLARLDLEDAGAEPDRARLPSEPDAARVKPLAVVADLVEVGVVEVGHACIMRPPARLGRDFAAAR